ncbi:MAG: hypothetical protein JWP35_2706 [Caulobacter sp.]|nr:hypothetical protein [Caulobacter sp.]
MSRFPAWLAGCLALAFALVAAPALAAPTFPALTGRVVDDAAILSPQTEAALTEKLAGLEQSTGRQVVVVTLPSLQGLEIEDYGVQLLRKWGIGEKGKNTGALFIVVPSERKLRVEVGYGLEPYLTDALSGQIIRQAVVPKFKAGDMDGGVLAGTNAIVEQLSLPDDQAKARVAAAPVKSNAKWNGSTLGALFFFIFLAFMVSRIFGGGRRGGGGLAGALPWIILGGLSGRGGRDDWGGGGGGGFSGGGGSGGGGGASGSW